MTITPTTYPILVGEFLLQIKTWVKDDGSRASEADAVDHHRIRGVGEDELIAGVIRAAYTVRDGERSFLVHAGKELVRLIGDDYEMLSSILHRIQD